MHSGEAQMVPGSINQALSQVRELRQLVIDRHRFKGYSGRARGLCGILALLTAAIMSSSWYPKTVVSQSDGWTTLVAVSIFINYGALLKWFFSDPDTKRDIRRLVPAFDVFPPFLVGCALTIALVLRWNFQYLFGIWMCSYGLINLSQHHVLPPSIRILGMYYILCGVLCLVVFHISYLNPLPMGIVFFIGEMWGGFIFHVNQRANANIFDYLIPSNERD